MTPVEFVGLYKGCQVRSGSVFGKTGVVEGVCVFKCCVRCSFDGMVWNLQPDDIELIPKTDNSPLPLPG
jgi:hypothetical protein